MGCRRKVGLATQGAALVATMLVAVVLTMLAAIVVTSSLADLNRATQEVQRSASYQAAEAGIEDYLAKLTEDRRYITKFVHPAESTRRKASGVLVAPGAVWDGSTIWTYPTPRNVWRSLSNGYEYNLQLEPPTAGSVVIKLVATGRKTGSTRWNRSIEVTVRAGSLADFQMVSNEDISYGTGATTNGKIYAGNGSNLNHDGTALKPLFAEGQVTGSARNSVAYYDVDRASPYNIRDGVNPPILFANFSQTRADVTASAIAGGLVLKFTLAEALTYQAWKLVFLANGTVDTSKCKGLNLEDNAPVCDSLVNRPMPANGAIDITEPVLISGTVDGRVTVATNQSVYISGNLRYETSGDDVIGLIARQSVIVTMYVPTAFDWRAATVSQNGEWRSAGSGGSHNSMTFTGATATYGGGSMGQFDTRVYNYDDTLTYLPPPYWPVLDDVYEVLSFRELNV